MLSCVAFRLRTSDVQCTGPTGGGVEASTEELFTFKLPSGKNWMRSFVPDRDIFIRPRQLQVCDPVGARHDSMRLGSCHVNFDVEFASHVY